MSNYTKTTNFATKDNLSPGNPLKIVKGAEIDVEYNNIATAVATKTDNSAAAITGGTITGITDLAIADGGTGASTAADARTNLGLGTIATQSASSVAITGGSVTGITDIAVADGGTGASTAANARTNLGLVIGTDVLAPNGSAANLTSFPTLNQNTTGNAATVTTNANLTGAVTSVGNATSLGSFTSANLLAALTDETGTGSAVFATSPTLVTPILGTPTSATLTNATGLPLSTGVTGTLPVANGGTGTATPSIVAGTNVTVTGTWPNQTIAASGGGGGTPGGSTTEVQYNNAGAFGGITGATTNGTALTLVAPVLGTPASATLTNATGLPLSTGVTGILPAANGGTGVANNAAMTVTGSGNFAYTRTLTGTTNVTLPTTGTLSTLAGTETLTNKTLTSPTLTTPVLGTPSSGTLSSCTVDGTDAVGFRNIPQNSQSAAYTLVLADAGKHIFHPVGDNNARTFTIPANSSVAYPIGTAITFINMAVANVTIAITTDTLTLSPAGTSGSRTLATNGSATCIKITSTEWLISGSGLT